MPIDILYIYTYTNVDNIYSKLITINSLKYPMDMCDYLFLLFINFNLRILNNLTSGYELKFQNIVLKHP